jgi:hypothetical protein
MRRQTPPESFKEPFAVRLLFGTRLLGVLSRSPWAGQCLADSVPRKKHVPTHWLRGRWPGTGVKGGLTHDVVTLLRQRAAGVRWE